MIPAQEEFQSVLKGEDRSSLREIINALQLPNNMGVIIRTAGVGRTLRRIPIGFKCSASNSGKLLKRLQRKTAPFLIHQESDVVIRTIRDYFDKK